MIECADVQIRWLTTADSGRQTPVRTRHEGSAFYRPHFRVGPDGEYLGVQFLEGDPPVVSPGEQGSATVELLYVSTGVDYSPLAPGASFEVLEGARVIGRGIVQRRFTTETR
jgi:hypothetical protein